VYLVLNLVHHTFFSSFNGQVEGFDWFDIVGAVDINPRNFDDLTDVAYVRFYSSIFTIV
jgi:hypothetical protein